MASFHNLQNLTPAKNPLKQGFSLIEVLVSTLLIVSFFAIAMQTLIAATAIKVKSEEISEATAWIQEDLEALRFEANRLDLSGSNYTPLANACTNGYATRLRNTIQTGGFTYSPNKQTKVNTLGGKQYVLVRTLTPQDDVLEISHQLYRDTNQDGNEDGTPIGELYSEIMPDAAFSCPA